MSIHCANVCGLLLLFHLAWEGNGWETISLGVFCWNNWELKCCSEAELSQEWTLCTPRWSWLLRGFRSRVQVRKAVPSPIWSLVLGWGHSPFPLSLPTFSLWNTSWWQGKKQSGEGKENKRRGGNEERVKECSAVSHSHWLVLIHSWIWMCIGILRGMISRAEAHA